MSTISQEARRALTEQRGAELEKWLAINHLRSMNFQDPISPKLSDMPAEILELVFEPFNTIDSINFRKVCRSLRAAVEKTELYFDKVLFWVYNDQVEMMLNNLRIVYTDDSKGNTIVKTINTKYKHDEKEKIFKGENFMQLAFKDLETMLKYAGKFEFGRFGEAKNSIATHLLNVLKAKKCVHLEEISLYFLSLSNIISILPYFDSQMLESIDLLSEDTNEHSEQLAQLEQWKNAKDCSIHGFLSDNIPIEHLLHFKSIDVELEKFSLQKVIEIRDKLLIRSTFGECYVWLENTNAVEVARIFQPHYSGSEDFKIEYLSKHGKFEITRVQGIILEEWQLIIKRC